MKSYEQIGCAIQALLEAGYELSVDVKMASKVPEFPMHWAHGVPVAVGIIRLINEGLKGFHLKFEGDDTENAQRVVEILRRYSGAPQEAHEPAGESEAITAAKFVMRCLDALGIDFYEFQLCFLRQRGAEFDRKRREMEDGVWGDIFPGGEPPRGW